MFKKQLFRLVPNATRYILRAAGCSWLTLFANIIFVYTVSNTFYALLSGATPNLVALAVVLCACLAVRSMAQYQSVQSAAACTLQVKQSLRHAIYEKLLRCGSAWQQKFSHAELVQMATEGVEQLELYFSQFLPQVLYSILATITLFVVIAPRSMATAVVLFVCIPLIPIAMMAVQKIARKMLNQYWGTYTDLGDVFLDGLEGLTTLKIYQADARYHTKMNAMAEQFRIITMKVLTMQLNSIIVMDFIAYGGSACAIGMSLWQYVQGTLSMLDVLIIVLLAADFFIPLRALGSLFHVTMNGIAAADKITTILDLPEADGVVSEPPTHATMACKHVSFTYPDSSTPALKQISITLPDHGITGIAGQSGSGKSTLAALLTRTLTPSVGTITLGELPLDVYTADALHRSICRIGYDSYLFAGSVRYNLRMAKQTATDQEMIAVLEQVRLWEYLKTQNGLDTMLTAGGSNLSGGQRQRLSVARALLMDAQIYIFDEATSNIDVESEEAILSVVETLREEKTIILISHRLQNLVSADGIYVLEDGTLAESGTHTELLAQNGIYAALFAQQQALEQYGRKPEPTIPEDTNKVEKKAERSKKAKLAKPIETNNRNTENDKNKNNGSYAGGARA